MENGTAAVLSTNYTITGLDEDRMYTITVKATYVFGMNAVSVPITAVTKEAGEPINDVI